MTAELMHETARCSRWRKPCNAADRVRSGKAERDGDEQHLAPVRIGDRTRVPAPHELVGAYAEIPLCAPLDEGMQLVTAQFIDRRQLRLGLRYHVLLL